MVLFVLMLNRFSKMVQIVDLLSFIIKFKAGQVQGEKNGFSVRVIWEQYLKHYWWYVEYLHHFDAGVEM